MGKDHTLYARVDGHVKYVTRGPKGNKMVDVVAAEAAA
jgi:large subunit ribosomal protein L27